MTTTNKILIGSAVGIGLLLLLSKSDNGGGTEDPTGNGSANAGGSTSGFNAQNIAEDLYDAMKDSGTDEDAITGILRYVTVPQFDLVFKAFGKRQYNSVLGNQVNPTAWFDELPYVDLKGWLKSELSASEYLNWKRKYPSKL